MSDSNSGAAPSTYLAWEQKLLANPTVAGGLRQLFAAWMGLPGGRYRVRLLPDLSVPASGGLLLATDHYEPLGVGQGPAILLRTPYSKGAAGSLRNEANVSALRGKTPQANSPITKGWVSTSPASRCQAMAESCPRRWSDHTDVSTRSIVLLASAGTAGRHGCGPAARRQLQVRRDAA